MLADIYLRPAQLYGFIRLCATPPLNYAHKPKDVSLCQTTAALPEHSPSHKSLWEAQEVLAKPALLQQ